MFEQPVLLVARLEERVDYLAAVGANLSVKTGREAADEGVAMLAGRDVIVEERQRVRVRDRIVLLGGNGNGCGGNCDETLELEFNPDVQCSVGSPL